MKRSINYLLVGIIAFCIFLTNSYAASNTLNRKPDDIPNSTYLIGNHLFTRLANEEYEGVLTTQWIMKASKTISSSELEDMVIYYKNARGNWVNALTGDPVEIPASYFSNYSSKILKISYVYGDILSDRFGYVYLSSTLAEDLGTSRVYNLSSTNSKNIVSDMIEYYISDSEEGPYELLEEKNDSIQYTLGLVDDKYVKARHYVIENNEKIYSVYSSVTHLQNPITVTKEESVNELTGEKTYTFTVNNNYDGVKLVKGTCEKINLSPTQYTFNCTVDEDLKEVTGNTIDYTVRPGEKISVVVMGYKTTGNTKKYSPESTWYTMSQVISSNPSFTVSDSVEYDENNNTIYTIDISNIGYADGVIVNYNGTSQYYTNTSIQYAVPIGTSGYVTISLYKRYNQEEFIQEINYSRSLKGDILQPEFTTSDVYLDSNNKIYADITITNAYGADGFDLYYTTSSNSNSGYNLVGSFSNNYKFELIFPNSSSYSTYNYYKIRPYKIINNTKKYSREVSEISPNTVIIYDTYFIINVLDDIAEVYIKTSSYNNFTYYTINREINPNSYSVVMSRNFTNNMNKNHFITDKLLKTDANTDFVSGNYNIFLETGSSSRDSQKFGYDPENRYDVYTNPTPFSINCEMADGSQITTLAVNDNINCYVDFTTNSTDLVSEYKFELSYGNGLELLNDYLNNNNLKNGNMYYSKVATPTSSAEAIQSFTFRVTDVSDLNELFVSIDDIAFRTSNNANYRANISTTSNN